VRARVASLTATAGAAQTRDLDAANAALAACNADPACARDGATRVKRIDAVAAAQRALDTATGALKQAEIDLFHANEAVTAACGAP
jgi:hypothetical protein